MKRSCLKCLPHPTSSGLKPKIKKSGRFFRKSDGRWIQKFQCLTCGHNFSHATFNPAVHHKKRRHNDRLKKLLVSGVSLRRSAKLLRVSRTTIARKLIYLGAQAKLKLKESNLAHPPCEEVQFDDQETFEHTKCKPLSITLAVDAKTRRILGFEISKMAANGPLAKIARKKYGFRKDERSRGRKKLFETLKPLVLPNAKFKSDENPHYPRDLMAAFPKASHVTFKGQRGSMTGQGELKKVRFDPLFSLNHTCAMTRANINRLFRKTWCTTKIPERLADHFAIYAVFHNLVLLPQPTSAS